VSGALGPGHRDMMFGEMPEKDAEEGLRDDDFSYRCGLGFG